MSPAMFDEFVTVFQMLLVNNLAQSSKLVPSKTPTTFTTANLHDLLKSMLPLVLLDHPKNAATMLNQNAKDSSINQNPSLDLYHRQTASSRTATMFNQLV